MPAPARPAPRPAAGLAAFLLLGGCGGAAPGAAPAGLQPAPTAATRAVAAGQLLVLECAGTPPPDTTVRFPMGERRLVTLRHGPPEQALFAVVDFPDNAFGAAAGDVSVTIRPRPGLYGIDLESDRPFRGARVTFKYARHFAAPAAARARHGSDAAFERELVVARVEEGTAYLLPSTRPATDNLSAAADGPGRYLVAGAP